MTIFSPLRHALQSPFITATAGASLIHGCWSIGVLFGGNPPPMGLTLAWIYWIIPPLLISFSLDIGQVSTAVSIKSGNRSKAKLLTFAIFSISNYATQFLYIAHHMPQLELSAGVRAEWLPLVTLIRDASLWFLPSLLPLSTLLYTFSDTHSTALPSHGLASPATTPLKQSLAPQIALNPSLLPLSPSHDVNEQNHDIRDVVIGLEVDTDGHTVHCNQCEFTTTKSTQKSAANALRAHKLIHSRDALSVMQKPNGNGVNQHAS